MAQHHNPKIVTDGLVFNLDTLGGRGPNKIITKPTQIDGCVLWLDADDKEAIVESSGAVSSWLDKSGNGNHASQGTGTKQPTYSANGMNGRGIITFDASTFDTLNAGDSSTIDVAGSITIITASRIADDIASGSDINTVHKDVQYSCRIQDVENGTISWADSQTWSYSTFGYHSAGLVPSRTAIVTQMRDSSIATECSGYVNGKQVYNKSHGSGDITTTANDCYIGSYANIAGWWDGQINEVLIYNRALSTDERQSVELYLSRKWNIPIQTSHREQTSPSTIQSSSLPVSGFKNGKLDQVGNSMYFMGGPNTTGGYKDYINCGMVLGNGSSYSSGDPFTYEVWAKDHGSETSWKTLIGSVGYSQIFFYGNSSIRFGKNGGGDGGTHMLTHAGQLHEWHHIAAVWVGGIHHDFSGDISTGPYRRILYVNGEEVDKDKEVFYGGNITNNYIGSYHANGLERCAAELAVARIYNRDLTHAEIKQNYNAQSARIAAMPKIPRPGNLKLYWDAGMFESYKGAGSGTTVYDLSGNGYDGTLVSHPLYDATLPENDMGKFFAFDGVSDSLDLYGASSLPPALGTSITCAVWARSTQSDTYNYLFDFDGSSDRWIFGWNGNSSGQIGYYNNTSWFNFGSAPNDGVWHHLVLVVTATKARCYIDGAQFGSELSPTTSAMNGTSTIGGNQSNFVGDIATTMFYAAELSQDEIIQLYDYHKHRYGK